MTDHLYDKSGKSGDDPEVAHLEQLLSDYAHRAPLRELPERQRSGRRGVLLSVSIVTAAAAAVILYLAVDGDGRDPRSAAVRPACGAPGTGFAFQVAGGAARCGGELVSGGTLSVGGWLEIPDGARAEVEVADIGQIQAYGGSRLRLVGTGPDEHRLELARGRISASVLAPPRLFVIDTPVAAAVDLGCAYDLVVDAEHRTQLTVTSGAVSLEGDRHSAYVPAGATVTALPGRGPGIPVAVDAAPAIRDAVARFDAGDTTAVAAIVETASMIDAITLWHLLERTSGADRLAAYRKLDRLSPRPVGVGEAEVLAVDRAALDAWRDHLAR
jgi:ferric-dicitrate binding protein FerR (iron transport regulator)